VKLRPATTALLLTAAALLTPAVVLAQFTSFVAPPRKAAVDSTRPTVAAAKTKADSVARMSLTDMKTWVDSAAGTSTQVAMASDTTAAASASVPVPAASTNASGRNTTTTFSSGSIAPNTASPLPFYLATGLVTLSAGLFLLRRKRARA
jgi:LPXTG-motif cell wall-anchored protein